jgi:hypothetical protein
VLLNNDGQTKAIFCEYKENEGPTTETYTKMKGWNQRGIGLWGARPDVPEERKESIKEKYKYGLRSILICC